MSSKKLVKLNPSRRMFCMRSIFCSCKDWITCVGIWKKIMAKMMKRICRRTDKEMLRIHCPMRHIFCWYIKHPAVEKHPDESWINTGSSLIEKMNTEKLTRAESHLKQMESTVFTAGSHSTVFYGLLLSCQMLIMPLAVHTTFSLTIFLLSVLLHSSSKEPPASTDELASDYIIWIRFLYWQ